MRAAVGIVVLTGLLLSVATGETVHMRDGRKFVGKVTRQGDKLKIEVAYGTIYVDQADVIYVLQGGTTQPAAPTTGPVFAHRPKVRVRPTVRWSASNATRPEPIVYMLTRQLELLGGEPATASMRRELAQWKITLHDERRKVGKTWLSREDQRRLRAVFEKNLAEAQKLANEARRYAWSRKSADVAKRRKLEAEVVRTLYVAAGAWPDMVIRNFLVGSLDLRAKKYEQAEQRFRYCLEAEPLVAAFHQGRGLALIGLKRPLEALEEFIACFQLRDDSYEAFELVEAAMKVTPGANTKDPVYLQAKQLLARYDKPEHPLGSFGTGTSWLLPGKIWRARDETLFTPPYDRIISKQALAVPITDNALLVDEDAIADAELVYVQAGRDVMLRADKPRLSTWGYRPGKTDVPLAAISVAGATFTPVDVENPAELKADQTVMIRTANLYRQMGTELRTGQVKVTSVGAEGAKLGQASLPGETVAAVFLGEAFAGFLTARCQPEEDGCGKSSFLKASDVGERVKQIKRTLGFRQTYPSYGRCRLKDDVPKPDIKGQVFLLHILAGEGPPKEFGK